MRNLGIGLVLLGAGIWAGPTCGFARDGSSTTRSFSTDLALTNAPIIVTVTFTNAESNALHGWFYSDQIPDGLWASTLSVKIDGRTVTNCLVESGEVSDVYPGCRPWRWVLERPPAFSDSNAIPASGTVELMYALNASVPGSFAMQQYSWCAWELTATNAWFGTSDGQEQQTVAYVDIPPPPRLDFAYTATGFELSFVGASGAAYLVQASTNLVDWVSVATNTTSISLVDTNRGLRERFYRAVWSP